MTDADESDRPSERRRQRSHSDGSSRGNGERRAQRNQRSSGDRGAKGRRDVRRDDWDRSNGRRDSTQPRSKASDSCGQKTGRGRDGRREWDQKRDAQHGRRRDDRERSAGAGSSYGDGSVRGSGKRSDRFDRSPEKGPYRPVESRGRASDRNVAGDRRRGDGRGNPRRESGRGRDDRLWTREGKPARGDRRAKEGARELTEQELRAQQLRSVRPHHEDPELPDDVTENELHRSARNELKALTKENAEWVAKHLAMVARLIDDDPEQAHQHALSASRRAGRIGVVRETLAITAYQTGDFALALRELRTYRRISGSDEHLPLMVDSERGMGRPERALELGRSVERTTLSQGSQVTLAIAMSGARLDLSQPELALSELQIEQLDGNVAYSWSPDLFHAYAEVLEELHRESDAATWRRRAEVAARALDEAQRDSERETVVVVSETIESPGEDPARDEPSDDSSSALTDEDASGAPGAAHGAGQESDAEEEEQSAGSEED